MSWITYLDEQRLSFLWMGDVEITHTQTVLTSQPNGIWPLATSWMVVGPKSSKEKQRIHSHSDAVILN